MRKAEGLIGTVSQYLDYLARICIFILMVIVTLNCITSKFNMPIFGAYEIATLFTALCISFSLAYCGWKGEHVFVTFLTDYFPKKIEKIVKLVCDIFSALICGIMGWQCWVYATNMYLKGETSGILYIPLHPIVYCISISFIFLTLVYLVRFTRTLTNRDLITGEEVK